MRARDVAAGELAVFWEYLMERDRPSRDPSPSWLQFLIRTDLPEGSMCHPHPDDRVEFVGSMAVPYKEAPVASR